MRPGVAIAELEKLKEEASTPSVLAGGETFTSWRARVKTIFTRSFGPSHHLVKSLDGVKYGLMVVTDRTPDSAWDRARQSGIRTACGFIDAAIFELGLLQGGDEPTDERAFDSELWDHVKGIVEDEDWGKVASQAAIFVEHRVRIWTGHPKDRNGEDLVGKGLFAAALADDAEYRLGRRAGEWEGWRMLGMGFAQALGNVDRHRIQDRGDGRRYALGVLGLASLILTQLRFEHGDHLHDE